MCAFQKKICDIFLDIFYDNLDIFLSEKRTYFFIKKNILLSPNRK
jgi:hypothetical protein